MMTNEYSPRFWASNLHTVQVGLSSNLRIVHNLTFHQQWHIVAHLAVVVIEVVDFAVVRSQTKELRNHD